MDDRISNEILRHLQNQVKYDRSSQVCISVHI